MIFELVLNSNWRRVYLVLLLCTYLRLTTWRSITYHCDSSLKKIDSSILHSHKIPVAFYLGVGPKAIPQKALVYQLLRWLCRFCSAEVIFEVHRVNTRVRWWLSFFSDTFQHQWTQSRKRVNRYPQILSPKWC